MSVSESATWYYVKKPSGVCVRTKLTPSSVIKAQSIGWVVSLTDICAQEPTQTITAPIQVKTIDELRKEIESLILYDGEFYPTHPHRKVIAQQIADKEAQIIQLEKMGVKEKPDVFTICIDVYRLSNGNVTTTRETVDYQVLANYTNIQKLLVRECGKDVPSIQEVRNYYGYTEPAPIEEPIEIPELLPEVIAEPQINDSITDNMVTQQVINFNIVNGRAVGSIKFVATNNFNPYWYGRNIFNIIQIKDPNGVNILTTVKENRLNFTETERDEVLTYNEDMQGNTRATVESFVWSSATQPTAFSKMYSIEISEAEPPKPVTSGFMSAGVAGAIAGLILIGFIADHKRGK